MKKLLFCMLALVSLESHALAAQQPKETIVPLSEAYSTYIQQKDAASLKLKELNQANTRLRTEIDAENNRNDVAYASLYLTGLVNITPFVLFPNDLRSFSIVSLVLSIIGTLLYIIYLYKWSKLKFRMMFDLKVLSRFIKKVLYNNLALLLFIALALSPGAVHAKTKRIDDVTFKLFGSREERTYIQCKYSEPKFCIDYDTINGIRIFQSVNDTFQKEYNTLAHLIGMSLAYDENEFLELYNNIATDDDYLKSFAVLLSSANASVIKETSEHLLAKLLQEGSASFDRMLSIFQTIADGLAQKGHTTLTKDLANAFVKLAIGKANTLEKLDDLVDLANKYEVLSAISEKVTNELDRHTQNLVPQDSLSIAHVYLSFNKANARKHFKPIQYSFDLFFKSHKNDTKAAEIIKNAGDPGTPQTLYVLSDLAKYASLQCNEMKIVIATYLSYCDSALSLCVYNTIASSPEMLSSLDKDDFIRYAKLTFQHKKDFANEFVELIAKAMLKFPVKFTHGDVESAIKFYGKSGFDFITRLAAFDKEQDYKSTKNPQLLLEFLRDIPSQKLKEFEEYFKHKEEFTQGILNFLFFSDRSLFFVVLEHAFKRDPESIVKMTFSNDIFDISSLEALFSSNSARLKNDLPATILLARHLLSQSPPGYVKAHKALIPHFITIFDFTLRSKDAIIAFNALAEAVLLQNILKSVRSDAFKSETHNINQIVDNYFMRLREIKATEWDNAIRQEENVFQGLTDELTKLRATNAWIVESGGIVKKCLGALFWLLFSVAVLSAVYALNAIHPNRNFNVLHWTLEFASTFGIFLLPTVVFFAPGLFLILLAQFFRGLLTRETIRPSQSDHIAASL